ncbi:MAG TPA: hypothetical protein VM369_01915 [Candidatus Binatia bacterium]|nr:hypothetical protein [Candidatus Binatia bacterium]
MGKRASGALSVRLVHEAARIVCEDGLSDYRLAKQKAAERLGLGWGAPMPSNADLQEAVLQYQRIFGGRAYAERLALMRRTAVQAMRLLKDFTPRLVGAVASGATTDGHAVQLHCFADKPEMIDLLLDSKGIAFEVSDRRYRYGDGQVQDVPVLSFDAAHIGVSVAVFPERDQRRAPLSPVDGAPVKRLDLAGAEALASESPETFG